jgi:hypothetical protein
VYCRVMHREHTMEESRRVRPRRTQSECRGKRKLGLSPLGSWTSPRSRRSPSVAAPALASGHQHARAMTSTSVLLLRRTPASGDMAAEPSASVRRKWTGSAVGEEKRSRASECEERRVTCSGSGEDGA